ncbi:phosphonate ABC transporter, permease protein PhnE [Reinekea thalattae]|uniref:Phosphonate ABC transporter, permease protein PhnE n=1 Tax=Reinekea thalattae TaxID=2593301 RepID=A0A5C8ZAQ6_9GAMM|nr:phosphonate ABC transporter, permease protein PhnE [Reinekea thalattae]TXR54524.1 phosphonate ABC transporter, permease protein PhnE [Reinekea thalattae]
MMSETYHLKAQAFIRGKQKVALAIPAIIFAYFVYVFFAFDILGLVERARPENGALIMKDMVSYKTHFQRDNRRDEYSTSIEGEAKGEYQQADEPNWISIDGDNAFVDMPNGHTVQFESDKVIITIPDYGVVTALPSNRGIETTLPAGDLPEWIKVSNTRVAINKPDLRVQVAKGKTTVYRYFNGWELFFFDMESAYRGLNFGELTKRVFSGELGAIAHDFWFNRMWRHGDVFWAICETVLMAFLGTIGAAVITLPLAFFAAKNFVRYGIIRQLTRRTFDLIRGIDSLIWTVILARAFGLGPMTGALSILITDVGTFGKLFSEALENADEKQIEGIRSTGANPLLRSRFGVIPQILPVLLSQVLYFLESNTRSATIIGAIVGGGIGLLLTQAMITQKDWEEVTYYIILVLLMVFAMDSFSSWLRGKLIGKRTK